MTSAYILMGLATVPYDNDPAVASNRAKFHVYRPSSFRRRCGDYVRIWFCFDLC